MVKSHVAGRGGIHWTDSLSRAGERARQVLYLLAVTVITVFGLLQIKLVVIPLLLALILAAAITPLVGWLRRRGWPDAAATGTSFVLLIIVFAAVVSGIVAAVRTQWDALVPQVFAGFDRLYALVREGPLPVDDEVVQSLRNTAADFMTSSAAQDTAVNGLFVVTELVTGFILMAVILFFFLKDGGRIWAFCLQPLRGRRLAKARLAGMSSIAVLGGYVRGTAIIALVDSVLIGAALFILQVPLALPLAVIVFVGAFIPLIGATAAGALAAFVTLVTHGPVLALIVVAVVIVVNQLEGNFLQPVVMGNTLNVHPLVILVALTAGTILAGVIGAILSVPLAAVSWAVTKIWVENRMSSRAPVGQPAAGAGRGTPQLRHSR